MIILFNTRVQSKCSINYCPLFNAVLEDVPKLIPTPASDADKVCSSICALDT